MERIIRNRSATLRKTFYVDGVAADPTGTPTAVVTRVSDGTTVTTGSVVNETEAGTWSITIPATSNTLLDTLTVVWTGVVNGVMQEYRDSIEVAGDTLFTIAEGLALLPTATVAQISDARTYAETELEGALGFALVPRYTLEKRTGAYCQPLHVKNPYVRAIRSATVNTVALSALQITALTFDQAGYVSGYEWGFYSYPTVLNNVTIGYEHGLDTPPPGATTAALSLAIDHLGGGSGSNDPRAESIITDDGSVRLRSGTGQFAAVGVNEWVAANRMIPVA
jgi:hypothetical protein